MIKNHFILVEMASRHIGRCHFCVRGASKTEVLELVTNALTSLLYTAVVWNDAKQTFTVDVFHNLYYTKFKVSILPADDDSTWWVHCKLVTVGSMCRELGIYAYHMFAAWEPLACLIDPSVTHPEYTPTYLLETHVVPCARTRADALKVLIQNGMLLHVLSDEEVYSAVNKVLVPLDVAKNGLVDDVDRFELSLEAVPRYPVAGDLKADFVLECIYPMLLNGRRLDGLVQLARLLRRPSNLPACSDTKLVCILNALLDQFDTLLPPPVTESYLVFECAHQLVSMNAHELFPDLEACLQRAAVVFETARSCVCAECGVHNKVVRAGERPTCLVAVCTRCVVCCVPVWYEKYVA